ncbi:hypothetical protein ACH5RR_031646 [Cinchona calisaya]|uniref:Uncharacterized protein n=1 Tax=Cinchona calisaya TaxID=153742 RepID=A0ABD2YFV1_9GENT
MPTANIVETMCLDGIFIIEFLRKIHDINLRNKDDPIFEMVWMKLSIIRDLILFENQLQFFVLEKLFDMTKSRGTEETLSDLAISALNCLSPGYRTTQNSTSFRNSPPEGVIHLLDLILC